ncbi:hypothetical protein PMIN04_007547 [Paraphaeosphaeria minitans]
MEYSAETRSQLYGYSSTAGSNILPLLEAGTRLPGPSYDKLLKNWSWNNSTKKKYLFMIDGLDAFDGDHKELVDLVTSAAAKPLVKSLQVEDFSNSTQPGNWLEKNSQVRFLNRTARDFLQSPKMGEAIVDGTGHDSFDTERRWANAYMGIIKTIHQSDYNTDKYFVMCMESALRVETGTGTTPATHLNELGRGAMCPAEGHHQWSIMEDLGDALFRGKLPFRSFIDFTV